jgi:hypothetical protein
MVGLLCVFGKFDALRRAIEAADRVAGNIAAVRKGTELEGRWASSTTSSGEED